MRVNWISVRDFLVGGIKDPVSKDLSSARVSGLICVALAGLDVVIRLWRKQAPDAPAIAALIAGGAVALLTRKQADS